MKIYVVTDGTFSDYHIEAVFTDHKKAADYLCELRQISTDKPKIEEWESDQPMEQVARMRYTCQINLITGEISREDTETVWAHPNQRAACNFPLNVPSGPSYCVTYDVGSFVSAEHCQKLAEEARQEYLRRLAQVGEPLPKPNAWERANYPEDKPSFYNSSFSFDIYYGDEFDKE